MKTTYPLSIAILISFLTFCHAQQTDVTPPATPSIAEVTEKADDSDEAKSNEETGTVTRKSMIGYWTVDVDFVTAEMQKAKRMEHPGVPLSKEEKEEISAMLKTMPPMVMHFPQQNKSNMHTISGTIEATVNVIAVRSEDGELDVDTTSDQHGLEEGTMKFTKGKMALMSRSDPSNKVVLKRISKEAAADLLKKIEEQIKKRSQ